MKRQPAPLCAWRPVPWRVDIEDIHNVRVLDADDSTVMRLHAAYGDRKSVV